MKDEIEMVRRFHEHLKVSAIQRIGEIPPDDEADAILTEAARDLLRISQQLEIHMREHPNDRRFLRAHLDCEELAEKCEAMARRDELGVLDAMADQAYVLFGSAVTFDLPLVSAFHEVHASNMTKEKQESDASKDRVRVKGPNYRPPDLASVLARYRRGDRELSAFRQRLDAQRTARKSGVLKGEQDLALAEAAAAEAELKRQAVDALYKTRETQAEE